MCHVIPSTLIKRNHTDRKNVRKKVRLYFRKICLSLFEIEKPLVKPVSAAHEINKHIKNGTAAGNCKFSFFVVRMEKLGKYPSFLWVLFFLFRR
jgi:hypothetical protein